MASWVDLLRQSVSTGTRGGRALRWTLLLVIAEVIIWVLLGSFIAAVENWPPRPGSWTYWSSFLIALFKYFADHLGDITMGIATTAYVIFTYQILESTEATRRQAAEPYVTLRWYRSNDPAENRLGLHDKLADDSTQWLRKTLGVTFRAEEMAAQRYLNIEISNARRAPLAWVQIGLTAVAVIPDQKPFEMRDQLRVENLNLQEGRTVPITVLDLGAIPTTANVKVEIETFVYGPVEGEVILDQYTGVKRHDTAGVYPAGAPWVEIAAQDAAPEE